MTCSWKDRGNQYIQFVRALYCKLPINGKQLPAFPLEAVPGTESRSQRWEVRVLRLCHHGPQEVLNVFVCVFICHNFCLVDTVLQGYKFINERTRCYKTTFNFDIKT